MKGLFLFSTIVIAALLAFACEKNLTEDSGKEIELKNAKNDKLTGFDEWGFNWQAQQFNGYTVNLLLGDTYFLGWPHYKDTVYHGEGQEFWSMLVDKYYMDTPEGDWHYFPDLMPGDLLDSWLISHWNEGTVSKDGVYPEEMFDTNGWISFHYSGEANGEKWSSFRKLVTARSSDELIEGKWYNDKVQEIGLLSVFWPNRIVVQVVNTGNVPDYPFFYYDYNSPSGLGFGNYKTK